MPTLSLEHFSQENDAGCLAACSQMVLRYLGTSKSQRQLNRLFQLTPFGVPFSRIQRLESFGVAVSVQAFGDERTITSTIDQQVAPIVFLQTEPLPYWQASTQHALVVVGYDASHFFVNDPILSQGATPISFNAFMLAWDGMDYAYALVTR